MLDLFGQHAGDRHRQRGFVLVVGVEQHLGQHMRTGQREFQRLGRQLSRPFAGRRQIERTRPDRAFDHARRSRAELVIRGLLERQPFGQADLIADA